MTGSRLGNVPIPGLSGRVYKFRAFPMGTQFAPFGAIYFITSRVRRLDGRISHSRIYCGHTANMSDRKYTAAQETSFRANDANCICVLPMEDPASRSEIERDIHRKYKLLCTA